MTSDRLAQLRDALAGRYDIDRPIGEGGMARVWLARDVKHDRRVAVKVLRRELGMSIGAERFAREIGIAAKLNHPNIVGVIDSGLIELGDLTLPYYVMPYVEGPSLRELLGRDGPLAPAEALRLGAEVADALDFAHARGVVHRDIKPGNILIQAGHALVADFGIARAVDLAGRDHATLTTEGILGTPVYMSPEQCRGEERLDGRSDVYSLGCVLYEVLCGQPPFEAATPQAVSLAHCHAALTPLAGRRPGLPADVARIVERALAKEPNQRHPSAAALRDDLERVRARLSGDATTAIPRERPRSWWPWAAAAVALIGVGLWRPWVETPPTGATTGPAGVVVLGGIRDRSGTMSTEAALLTDALRQELQRSPDLRVLDASDRGELGADSLRRMPGATWVVLGTIDRVPDSV
ncbi:MAG: serine/threonine protein kinase, partial [Gemmatimonadales bacterium]|nr:serine/threonine protein kinase [Gemmatimonadales bacterium]